jgi:hypothetical protein
MLLLTILWRFLLAVVGVGLLFVAFDGFYNCFQEAPVLVLFEDHLQDVLRHIDRMDFRQGLPVVQGFFALGLGLWALNAALRNGFGRGPVDAILAEAPLLAPLAAALLAVPPVGQDLEARLGFSLPTGYLIGVGLGAAFVGFALNEVRSEEESGAYAIALALFFVALGVALWFVNFRFHADPGEAVDAFRTQKVQVTNTGTLLFGRGEDGRVHMTWLTPDLVRALDRESLNVNAEGKNEAEFPLPGFLPVVLLLVLAALWLRARRDAPGRSADWTQGGFALGFGIINLYMVGWLLFASLRVYSSNYTCIVLAGLGVPFTALGARSIASDAWWAFLFFPIHLGAVVGIYAWSFKTAGTPAVLWMLAYLGAGAFCWWTCATSTTAYAGRKR